jgi:hypothetical protein
VVVVLIASCQVSLKPSKGPASAQRTTKPTALKNVAGFPAKRDAISENAPNQCLRGIRGTSV